VRKTLTFSDFQDVDGRHLPRRADLVDSEGKSGWDVIGGYQVVPPNASQFDFAAPPQWGPEGVHVNLTTGEELYCGSRGGEASIKRLLARGATVLRPEEGVERKWIGLVIVMAGVGGGIVVAVKRRGRVSQR
jgi:hypothetical protein